MLCLRDHPEWAERAAQWFHEKWGIPLGAYAESIGACLARGGAVPQWYLAVAKGRICGGLGVIENDFHARRDLSPNVCAVYVEPEHRGRGLARRLLRLACQDLRAMGVDTLYLVTDHTGFYERCGWQFFCMVQCEGEAAPSRMYRHIEP